MPRSPRLLLSQSYYHIMARGNNHNQIFRSDSDYLKYLELINKFKAEHSFDLYHYCLMPNHIHMLVKTNKFTDFSTFMKRLELAYYYYYKNQYGWVGHLWQGRYKNQSVGKDNYFVQCGKYIELNPVRAGIVKLPQEYKFSSFKYYFLGISNKLITTDFIYEELGKSSNEQREKYYNLVISDIITESYTKKSWGSPVQRYNEQKKIKNRLLKNTW